MPQVTLTIKDETATGKTIHELQLWFASELTTVREIIKTRVMAEVDAYNSKMPEYFYGLVQPNNAEKSINGFKLKDRKKVDAEKQYLVAQSAFQKNGFFILIDNIQSESLDQMLVINDHTNISFIKLTPLVGG